jgi:hypothetical protein
MIFTLESARHCTQPSYMMPLTERAAAAGTADDAATGAANAAATPLPSIYRTEAALSAVADAAADDDSIDTADTADAAAATAADADGRPLPSTNVEQKCCSECYR